MGRFWIWFDYAVLLRFLTFLPYGWGRRAAIWRGYVYGLLKRDWRSFSFGDEALWERSRRAYGEIVKGMSESELRELVLKRYENQSIEEFEGAFLAYGVPLDVSVRYEGVAYVEEVLRESPHAVFVTAHFGSSILGITFLEKLGVAFLVMSSNVVTHERVHPTLSEFFLQKYRGISSHMNGGEVLDIEGNGKRFLGFLKREGSLVILADLPPNNPNEVPTWKMFFSKERGFASGSEKLAASCGSKIIPFVCYFEEGCYVMRFGEKSEDAYGFFEKEIGGRPHMWWAADILPMLRKKESVDEQI